jgi:hypothetical protein
MLGLLAVMLAVLVPALVYGPDRLVMQDAVGQATFVVTRDGMALEYRLQAGYRMYPVEFR